MHETAIVTGLMKILDGKAAEHGFTRITKVRLKLGRLRGLDPRQIRGAFEVFSEGSPADGAELVIEEVPVAARCRACGHDYTVEGWQFACPACGSDDADIVAGRELYVESFDAH